MHWVAHHYSVSCLAVICLPRMDECYYYLWRDTTSKLWTPVLLINLRKRQLQTCYFLQTNIFLPHIRLIFCYSKPVGLTPSPLRWEKNTLIVFCADSTFPTPHQEFLAPLTPRGERSSPTGSITLVS